MKVDLKNVASKRCVFHLDDILGLFRECTGCPYWDTCCVEDASEWMPWRRSDDISVDKD